MGRKADPQITSHFGLYNDEALQQFIDEKGRQIVDVSHREELNYEFKILDSPVVNAFAVPGGYVYFTRGIMAYFNNGAQFAGVLGHEVGHIAARHSAKRYSKSQLAQLGLAVGSIVSPEFRQFADLAQTGLSLLFLKYSRDAERQADKLGVEYSTKIGYDAEEMAEFFHILERKQQQSGAPSVPTFLSTHPDPRNRSERVFKLANKWQKKLGKDNLKVKHDAYLKLIDGMIYGKDPKKGYVENNVFYHPVLKFQFPVPQGWLVQNSAQQVQIIPKDGKALMTLTLVPGQTLKAAAQALLEKYQLTLVESKEVNVNALPAIALVAEQQQRGQTVRTLTYLIGYGGNIYSIMGISSANDFNRYLEPFTRTMTNFSVLTDPDKINKQPERIQIVTVQQNTTLAEALREHNVAEDRLQELAVLNGMTLDDQLSAGMLIKVLEN